MDLRRLTAKATKNTKKARDYSMSHVGGVKISDTVDGVKVVDVSTLIVSLNCPTYQEAYDLAIAKWVSENKAYVGDASDAKKYGKKVALAGA